MTQQMEEQQLIHDLIEQAERGPLVWDGYDWLREQDARAEYEREMQRARDDRFNSFVAIA